MPPQAKALNVSPLVAKGAVVPHRFRLELRHNGKRYRSLITARDELHAWAQATPWRDRTIREIENPTKAKAPTLKAFWEDEKTWKLKSRWFTQKHSLSYRLKVEETCDNWLIPKLGKLTLDRIDTAKICDLRTALEKRCKDKATKNALDMLRRMLNLAHEWDYIAKVPKFPKITLPRSDPKYLELPDLEKLLTAARNKGHETYTMVLCGVDSGTRSGEQIALQWRDITATDLHVREAIQAGDIAKGTKAPKSGHTRHVPLSPDLRDALATLKAERLAKGIPCGPLDRVFPDLRTTSQLYQRISRLAASKDCGITASRHQLRHTYASHLISNGATLFQIQTWLGQQSPAMAQRYAYLVQGLTMGVSVAAMARTPQAQPEL